MIPVVSASDYSTTTDVVTSTMNANDYEEHLLLNSLGQHQHQNPNQHHPTTNYPSYHYQTTQYQHHHQRFHRHHHHQQHQHRSYERQHNQHQQFGHHQYQHQNQHQHSRRRHSCNDIHNHSSSYIHSHSKDQSYDQTKQIVSTVSLSTEEMDPDPFDDMELFVDDCEDDDKSKSDFDDIDIDIEIDSDAKAEDINNVVTPTRKKKQPLPSSSTTTFSNHPKASRLKQDNEGSTTATMSDDNIDKIRGNTTAEIEQKSSSKSLSPFSSSRKQSIIKNKNKNRNNDEDSNSNSNNNNNKKVDHIVDVAIRVEIPNGFDILCGQSRICASHTGNKRFQTVLDTYATRYDSATSKQEKMIMTKEIVACIHNSNGRFLKYKNSSNNEDIGGIWEEISNVAARDKVSHALRTKVSSWKRQQQQLLLQAKDESNNNKDGGGVGGGGGRGGCAGRRRTSMSKSRHRKGGIGRNRRSSSSSFASNASDIMTNSFDGGSDSTVVVSDLMKAQRQIFATLITSSPKVLAVTTETPSTTACIKSEQPLLELLTGAINNDHPDYNDRDIEPHHPLNKNRIPCRRSSSYF